MHIVRVSWESFTRADGLVEIKDELVDVSKIMQGLQVKARRFPARELLEILARLSRFERRLQIRAAQLRHRLRHAKAKLIGLSKR